MAKTPTREQQSVLSNEKDRLIVSASAGSGKTWVLIEYITKLVIEKKVPVRKILVLTFTKAAAGEMKQRLYKSLMEQERNAFVIAQIDDLSIADISTIDGFCEKLVKRHLDKLPLDEGFCVLEDASLFQERAFELAIESMNQLYPEMLNEIYYAFRKNKPAVFECIQSIEGFFNATDHWQEKCDYFIKNQSNLHLQAMKTVNEDLLDEMERIKLNILTCQEKVKSVDKYDAYCNFLYRTMDLPLGDDLVANLAALKQIRLPSLPMIKEQERDQALADLMKSLRQTCKTFLDNSDKYDFSNPIYQNKVASGILAQSLLQLYKEYQSVYQATKQIEDVVDFADLEQYATLLLSDKSVLDELQDKFDYVFLDEYQDTNRIQEAFLKPIAQKGNFVAVGDPKQGIYGFRNATMEIMQQDMDTFAKDDHSDVIFLRGNFRSDCRVLSFINSIFEKLITVESVGIDYSKTSMLEGMVPFSKPMLTSVCIDVVAPQESTQDVLPGVYSVKNDELLVSEKDALEVETICARIDSCLMEQIYDAKLAGYRPVTYRDITILLRSRSSLMSALSRALQARGYPTVSDEKTQPTDEAEVQVLIHVLALSLNPQDDIALAAVLLSQLGGFSVEELAKMRMDMPDAKTFQEVFYAQAKNNTKAIKFMDKLQDFVLNCNVLGIYAAFMHWFQNTNYDAYLALQQNGNEKKKAVYAFLRDISQVDAYDIAKAYLYAKQVGGRARNSYAGGVDAINIMTIHGSKGLEYPIVILAGAGHKLESVKRNLYELHEKYGIGTYIYDEKQNKKASSPLLEVIRKANKQKEMVDELMIFYVAMTRAQNHLFIVGSEEIDKITIDYRSPLQCRNYLELIFYALGKKVLGNVRQQETFSFADVNINYITKVENLRMDKKTTVFMPTLDKTIEEQIQKYFTYEYPNAAFSKFHLKNSVTGVTALQPMQMEKDFPENKTFNNDNEVYDVWQNKPKNNGKQKDFAMLKNDIKGNEIAIETGNAYHEALKILNFEKVVDFQTCEKEFKNIKNKLKTQSDLVDLEILLKNILLLKPLIKDKKIYKEKQFVMQMKVRDLIEGECENKVFVQGVVDLFAIGGKNIVIDFKYTQENNTEKIINKYRKQLELYTTAIEKAFAIKINEKYILSLKNAKLIPLN